MVSLTSIARAAPARGRQAPPGWRRLTPGTLRCAKSLFSLVGRPGSRVALSPHESARTRGGGAKTMEKILVPLDGSDLAEAALETAIDILKEHPATTLLLLRAAELPRASGADPWTAKER